MIKVFARGNKRAEILIHEPIGEDWIGNGLTSKRFDKDLKALGDVEQILVRINSPGGSAFDGIAIYNALKSHPAKVEVIVDGLAASAASFIAMAGDTISMARGAMMMIHNPFALAIGDAEDMRVAAEMLDKVASSMIDIYEARTELDRKHLASLCDAETWFTGREAVDQGFADVYDEVDNEEATDAAAARQSGYRKGFADFADQFRPSADSVLRIAASIQSAPADLAMRSPSMDKPEKTAPAPADATVNTAAIEAAAREATRAALEAETIRRTDIRTAYAPFVEQHRDLLDACLDDVKCTAEAARAKLLVELGKNVIPLAGNVQVTRDAREGFRVGAEQSLLARAGIVKRDEQNEFNGQSLCDLAAAALRMAGVSVRGMSKDQIARKALSNPSASLTTSDFPLLLSSTAGKTLQAAYSAFDHTWRKWVAVGSVSDFKIHPRVKLGSFAGLDTIPEGMEYTYAGISEAYETAQAATKGKAIKFTRQMLVNDDLGGFTRRARLMGDSAARTVNVDVYAYLTSGSSNHGPTTLDAAGQFFNATAVTSAGGHANLTSSGTAISVASLGVGRTSMRKQKDQGLLTTLNIQPKILLTPVGKEDLAKEIVTSTTKDAQANANQPNVLRNAFEVVSDPYLDGISATAWYLFASPGDPAAAFEVVFLDGNETPFVDEQVVFATDALEFKVRLDYGVAIGDWRGGYKNVGA